MSSIEQILNDVGEAIRLLPAVAGKDIGVIVDNQQNLEAELEQVKAKCMGWAIIIGEVNNNNRNEDNPGPSIRLNFGVTIYTPEIITESQRADGWPTGGSLRDIIIPTLHHAHLTRSKLRCDDVRYQRGAIFTEDSNPDVDEKAECSLIHALSFQAMLEYKKP